VSVAAVTAVIVALAGIVAAVRGARRPGERSRALVVVAQLALAALFYFLLFPPERSVRGDALTVLTPGATAAQVRARPRAQRVVALPDAAATADAVRAPDLATALRLYPKVRALDVIGGGLPARDREAAAGLAASFDPAPARGLTALESPRTVALGAMWTVSGRVAQTGARVELVDPSGAVVGTAAPDADGRFRLAAAARGLGPARFALRVLDDRRQVVASASVPVVVRAGEALSIIVRAGAPDAELKYFRRWAADAGFSVQLAAGLTEGIMLREGDASLAPDALAQADLVILDERAWLALDAAEKTQLRAAVEDGLGLLLRVDGPVEASVASDWSEYAWRVKADAEPRTVTLDRRLVMQGRTGFSVAPVIVEAAAQPLIVADDGDVLAAWRGTGRGRVGVLRLTDSFRLVLLGEQERYGTLWSGLVATLARARPAASGPETPARAWVDERAVICRLGDAAQAVAPDGSVTELIVDATGCAAYWPATAGWQQLRSVGETSWLYVRDAADGADLRAARDARATALLPQAGDGEVDTIARDSVPMSRVPLFLAWLLLAAGVWWRERTRSLVLAS
jgi:hypothetical protein